MLTLALGPSMKGNIDCTMHGGCKHHHDKSNDHAEHLISQGEGESKLQQETFDNIRMPASLFVNLLTEKSKNHWLSSNSIKRGIAHQKNKHVVGMA